MKEIIVNHIVIPITLAQPVTPIVMMTAIRLRIPARQEIVEVIRLILELLLLK